MKHGASAYRRGKCRCGTCTAGHKDRQRHETQLRHKRLEAGTAQPWEHGAYAYTNWHCRCETCTEANKAKARAYRELAKAAAS